MTPTNPPPPRQSDCASSSGLRRQYHFRPSANGYYAWDVHRLIALSRDLPIISIDPDAVAELNESYWFDDANANPTCRDLIAHMRLVAACDFDHPIILCDKGRVMDGMHRVVKAVLEGRKTIDAVRFDVTPAPDHADVRPEDLPYD